MDINPNNNNNSIIEVNNNNHLDNPRGTLLVIVVLVGYPDNVDGWKYPQRRQWDMEMNARRGMREIPVIGRESSCATNSSST